VAPIHVPFAPRLALALTGVALLCFGAACALWPSRMAAMTELSLPGRVNAVTWLALGMELVGLVLNAWALGQLR
jgi:hypothetical protein